MANYITVDSGTTNTRISLVCDNVIKDTVKYTVGARKGITEKDTLKNALKEGINALLANNGATSRDIVCVLACGMITSEFGLCNLPHIVAPVGMAELHSGLKKAEFKDICDIPFYFVRGVKTDCKSIYSADMMRGEECEIMGLLNDTIGADVFVLPGSHSKTVKTDRDGKITEFSTTLTGEMIAALSDGTILKDAVDLNASRIDKEFLLAGFRYAKERGLNEAAFKVRVLKNIFSETKDRVYAFFMGAVLCAEILNIQNLAPKKVAVGGKRQIKAAMCEILKALDFCEVVEICDTSAESATTFGMIKIFEYEN